MKNKVQSTFRCNLFVQFQVTKNLRFFVAGSDFLKNIEPNVVMSLSFVGKFSYFMLQNAERFSISGIHDSENL